jgi:hypothetical protein
MNTHSGTLYPMLAVGAFMCMFWTGIVVGHELGLTCFPLLAAGLLSGCVATIGVAELERRDRQGIPRQQPGEAPSAPRADVVTSTVARPRLAPRESTVPAASAASTLA